MSPTIKRVAFLFCCWPLIVLTFALLPHSSRQEGSPGDLTPAQRRARLHPTGPPKWFVLAPLVLAYGGAIVLVIDAFRRDYDAPGALPIALAVMGFLTVGASSAIYYMLWGWMPTQRDPSVRTAFCQRCVGETSDRSARSVGTHNLIGTRLIGQALRCDQCGSTVKTYWLCFMLPLIPLASYRVLPIGQAMVTQSRFISRKIPGLHWPQVWPNLAMVAGLVVLVAIQSRQ